MPYTSADFLAAAARIESLSPHLMQSDFYAMREWMMARLREAALSPNDPRSLALMTGVKFMVYAPLTTSPTIQ